ncbi:MAG: hypothetical protein KDJ38_09225, partial [Gammaproteobacteria bacterium]|nr:hypothetical protein [Gammaproteobacteria bacterium]
DAVNNDRYAFAGNTSVVVPTPKGVLANDGSDFKSVELVSGVNASSSLTLNADGSFLYTPGPQIATDGFTYRALTESGSAKAGSVTLVIAQPVAGCSELIVTEAQSGTFSVMQGDITKDDGLTFSLVAQPVNGAVSLLDAQTGQLSYSYNGAGRGLDKIRVQVSDAYGGSSEVEHHVALGPVRVMPLGDSITEGVESDSDNSGDPALDTPAMPNRSGYRKPLFDLLNGNGYEFDFVGSRTTAGFNVFSDFQHEGHPGYSDAEISGISDPTPGCSNSGGGFDENTEGVYNWLTANPAEVVLLHAGTNNVNCTNRADSVYIERILDEVDRWESDNNTTVKVLVALIIDKQRGGDNSNVETFNASVQSLVNNRIGQGDDLKLVDIYNAVPASYLDPLDKTHLTPAGYQKMAEGWMSAIDSSAAIASCN